MYAKSKNIVLISGVIGIVVGIVVAIPNFLRGNELLGTIAVVILMAGLILFAIGFGDEQ